MVDVPCQARICTNTTFWILNMCRKSRKSLGSPRVTRRASSLRPGWRTAHVPHLPHQFWAPGLARSFASWATEGARSSALLPLVQWTKDKLDKATATQRVWYMVLVLVAYFVYSRWGEIQYTVMDLVKGGKRKIF